MTPDQQVADKRALQEFEAAEGCWARGAPPETYRVQIKRILENIAVLPPARKAHWNAELARIGESTAVSSASKPTLVTSSPPEAPGKP